MQNWSACKGAFMIGLHVRPISHQANVFKKRNNKNCVLKTHKLKLKSVSEIVRVNKHLNTLKVNEEQQSQQ